MGSKIEFPRRVVLAWSAARVSTLEVYDELFDKQRPQQKYISETDHYARVDDLLNKNNELLMEVRRLKLLDKLTGEEKLFSRRKLEADNEKYKQALNFYAGGADRKIEVKKIVKYSVTREPDTYEVCDTGQVAKGALGG